MRNPFRLLSKIKPSSQCFETFRGLYLQVCIHRAIFQLTCSQKYCRIHYAYAEKQKYFALKSENKLEHTESYNTLYLQT